MFRGRPKKVEIPIDKHKDICDYYVKLGKGLKEIAAVFGSTPYIIRQILTANEIPIKRAGGKPGVVPKHIERLLEARRAMLKAKEEPVQTELVLTAPLGEPENVA